MARDYHRDLVADRGMDVEAQMLEIILEIQQEPFSTGLAIKEIGERFIARHSEDFERKITPHWVGYIIRRKLGLKTERHMEGYRVSEGEKEKLSRLYEKYGLTGAVMNSMNSVNSEKGSNQLDGDLLEEPETRGGGERLNPEGSSASSWSS